VRVSTDRQAERLGLDVQERTIRAWARASGHRIAQITRDEGVSGSNGLDAREGLLDALEAIRDKRAAGLVVARLDRLARDLIVQEQILAEIRRLGGEVFSCSAAESDYVTDDPNDPTRALIRQVLGAVSQYERSVITLRLRAGRRLKVQRGGHIGSPPYGYKAADGELVPDEAEQAVLALMRKLRAEGCSYRQIADQLASEGTRPRRGQTWGPATLKRILDRA